MSGVLLGVPQRKAREIVVATRMPPAPKLGTYFGSPWNSIGDVVADCTLCGYHAQGLRDEVGKAMKAHHQMYHSQLTGVILLNTPRQ